jgi:hypothetical protein
MIEMTLEEETDLCNGLATKASQVIVDGLVEVRADGRAVLLATEMLAVCLLIQTDATVDVVDLFCERVKSRVVAYRKRKAN